MDSSQNFKKKQQKKIPVYVPASMVLDDVAVSPVAPSFGDMVGVSSSLVFFAGGAFVLSSTVSTFLFGGILVSYTVI